MMPYLLLDAYNLLYRSFVSIPEAVVDGSKRPINAVYGMVAAIIRLSRDLGPAGVLAAFDVPAVPTFRHEIYPAYQGHRGPMGGERADEFARQVEIARERLPAVGIPAVSAPGYEADDVMGTLARALAGAGKRSIIVSTDRDLLQLVGPAVALLSPGKGSGLVVDEEGAREILGVPPNGVTTFKALAGDPSDNIPGLPGIGAKTAVSLVNQYGDLEAIYAHLDALAPRVSRVLGPRREEATLYRRVATIVTDLDLPVRLDDLRQQSVTGESRVRDILDAMGLGAT